MAETYNVKIKVVSQQNICRREHKVGDEWVIKEDLTPKGLCLGAFGAMWPYVRMLMFGASSPFSDGADTLKMLCPDPRNPVVFEIKRIPK